ncbi:MAG: hypothetical protein JW822_09160 [Spirochaetales bacterium]|nr:hypothetical protein [Spirochaetales bacterium]
MKTNQGLEIKDGKIFMKEGEEVPFSDIRVVSMVQREGLDMAHFFYSGGSYSYVNLDLIDNKQVKEIYDVMINLWDEMSKNAKHAPSEKKKLKTLEAFGLYLQDYQGNTIYTSLRMLKETDNMELLTNLYNSRSERRKKIKEWLSADPVIELKNGKLKFSKQGCQVKKRLISWDKVQTIQFEKVNFSTLFYVLPEGVSGGMFSFKKSFYAININAKEAYIYGVEYFFWKTLADENFLEK